MPSSASSTVELYSLFLHDALPIWTIAWTFIATSFQIVLGLFLAVLVNDKRIKFKRTIRTVLILPWAVPAFVSILIFAALFNPTFGRSEEHTSELQSRGHLVCRLLLRRLSSSTLFSYTTLFRSGQLLGLILQRVFKLYLACF